jgi:ABC-2 type transport system permease protein
VTVTTIIPSPLDEPPPPQPFLSDFSHLLKAHLRVAINKVRRWPILLWIVFIPAALGFGGLFVYLGVMAYRTLVSVGPQLGGGLLSLAFLGGVIGQVFFGIPSAFVTLYMSEDLDILFASPVSIRAVFAVKSLVVAVSNFLPVLFFVILPGIFYALLFKAGLVFYLILLLVVISLWVLGTALAVFLNLFIMRIVPPHRSREAVGVISAVAGIVVAMFFQIPNIMLQSQGQIDFAGFVAGNESILQTSFYFPWGWGSQALVEGISGNMFSAFGWGLLSLVLAAGVFAVSFTLLERGFRRGWVSVTQPPARRRRKTQQPAVKAPVRRTTIALPREAEAKAALAPVWHSMWAIAKKDLLYIKRDTREWFSYLTPLIFMAFFIGQHLLIRTSSTHSSLVGVWLAYVLMFSGNTALQSFGREGEAEWVLRSVPSAGTPVVLGKLIASVIPTLFLMEALLAGTAVAVGYSASFTSMLAVGAVFLALGSSSIGLFYSATSARYNPDNPHQRIAPGASLIMSLVNLLFMLLLAFGLLYLIPPAELIAVVPYLYEISPKGGFAGGLHAFAVFVTKPLLWSKPARILTGILVTGGIWSGFFFGFLAAAVRQAKKGIHIEPVVVKKKKARQGWFKR